MGDQPLEPGGTERWADPPRHFQRPDLADIDGALGAPGVPAAMAPSSLSFGSAGNFFEFLA